MLNIVDFEFSLRSFSDQWDWSQLDNNLDKAEKKDSRKKIN